MCCTFHILGHPIGDPTSRIMGTAGLTRHLLRLVFDGGIFLCGVGYIGYSHMRIHCMCMPLKGRSSYDQFDSNIAHNVYIVIHASKIHMWTPMSFLGTFWCIDARWSALIQRNSFQQAHILTECHMNLTSNQAIGKPCSALWSESPHPGGSQKLDSKELDALWIPVTKSWKLNERMCSGLACHKMVSLLSSPNGYNERELASSHEHH